MQYLHLGEQMGAERTLPYLSPQLTGQKLLVGANFASAGIGILNDTGIQFVSSTLIKFELELFHCLMFRKSLWTQLLSHNLTCWIENRKLLSAFESKHSLQLLLYYVLQKKLDFRKIVEFLGSYSPKFYTCSNFSSIPLRFKFLMK